MIKNKVADEQNKDDALTPWQSQSLTRRSAALVRRGLAEALTLQSSEAYYNRGLAKYYKSDYDGAIDDCIRAIEINPRYAKAYCVRGLAKEDKGDHDGAIDDYTRAIEINPRYAEFYYNRGLAKYYKSDYDGAIDDYTKAIEINPRDAWAYYNRGLAKQDKGDLDSAIADYTKAIEIDPGHAWAYYNRGIAKKDKGIPTARLQESSKQSMKLSDEESKRSTKEALKHLNHPVQKKANELWNKMKAEKATKQEDD